VERFSEAVVVFSDAGTIAVDIPNDLPTTQCVANS
jgi:hypothetical protein